MSHSPRPVKGCLFIPLCRIVRISSLFSRIIRSFSFSLWSVVIVFSCNTLRLLTVLFLILFVWYGTPPSFLVCLANGSLLDFLLGSSVFGFLGSNCFLLKGVVIRRLCWCGPAFVRICCSTRSRRHLI